MSKQAIELTKVARQEAIKDIQLYFRTEREEELSDFTAGSILDFFLSHLGPFIYNQGLADSYRFMQEKVEDLLGLEKTPPTPKR